MNKIRFEIVEVGRGSIPLKPYGKKPPAPQSTVELVLSRPHVNVLLFRSLNVVPSFFRGKISKKILFHIS